jgi:hypothetical protein
MAAKKRKFSAKTEAAVIARLAKAGQRGRGSFQNPPSGETYNRPAGTTPVKAQRTGPLNPHQNPLPTSGLDIFPAVRVATRRLQSHVGPSPQDSRITRRRRS